MMKSKILTTFQHDDERLYQDVQTILGFPYIKDTYTEFSFGTLIQHVLWNESGKASDTVFHEFEGKAIPTEFGKQLPYLNEAIEKIFHTDTVQMVRANLMQDCLLIPHRDYTEIEDGYNRFYRLHLPIHTNPTCKNSDGEIVFHMDKGEVWFLDISAVHAAWCPTDFPRISICIDFKTEGRPLADCFRDPEALNQKHIPTTFEKEAISPSFQSGIDSLSRIIHQHNFKDIVQLLAKIHFYKQAGAKDCFEWLIEICKNADDPALLPKAYEAKRFFTVDRKMNQRFSFEQFQVEVTS